VSVFVYETVTISDNKIFLSVLPMLMHVDLFHVSLLNVF